MRAVREYPFAELAYRRHLNEIDAITWLTPFKNLLENALLEVAPPRHSRENIDRAKRAPVAQDDEVLVEDLFAVEA